MSSLSATVYGSILTIKDLATWTDDQIVDLAHVAALAVGEAHTEALRNPELEDRLNKNKLPRATTTMVVGNTAYISSSLTGGLSFFYVPAVDAEAKRTGFRFRELRNGHGERHAVGKALVRCQIGNLEKLVRNPTSDTARTLFRSMMMADSATGRRQWSSVGRELRRADGCISILLHTKPRDSRGSKNRHHTRETLAW
jgi:hypothetical protein